MPDWIKPAIWGVVGGAVAVTVIEFSAGWVTTTGSAQAMAADAADQAVLAALTPICVARFTAETPEVKQEQIAALKKESSWKRGDLVAAQGWATLPGMDEPNEDLAEVCSEKLLETAKDA
jgi:hypothetical protein